jgi:hypothetical protein
MANITIPNMPAAVTLTGQELMEVVQGNVSKRITAAQLATLIQGSVTPIGSFLSYVGPTGTLNNAFPPGFASTVGRLWVTLPAGPLTLTGLTLGNDAQLLAITNADAANMLTLNVLAGGSSTNNQFYGAANYGVPPGNTVFCCYYGGLSGVNKWVIL